MDDMLWSIVEEMEEDPNAGWPEADLLTGRPKRTAMTPNEQKASTNK